MADKKVSFILGIYNAERTLRECLNSILMQDFPENEYEILIIDGGSTDKTLEIVRDFQVKSKTIKLFHNPKKLSEGRGMSKDLGVEKSRGEILIFLDHDNILLGGNWLKEILVPFNDESVMASQSLLEYKENDSNFLKYVNSIGVEDPFAVPYSLTAQAILNPKMFKKDKNILFFKLTKKSIYFIGANGCAFRKKVFDRINGYTRDVDVSASMARHNMKVAIPLNPRVYHNTSNNFISFIKKKGIYFYRFINNEYKVKSFKWTEVGSPPSKIRFFMMVLLNFSILFELVKIFPKFLETKEFFWLLHPFYVFFVTLEYGLLTLFKLKNFMDYL